MVWDGEFRECLSVASQPKPYSEELPGDLRQDEDLSNHEGDTLIIDCMGDEEGREEADGVELSIWHMFDYISKSYHSLSHLSCCLCLQNFHTTSLSP